MSLDSLTERVGSQVFLSEYNNLLKITEIVASALKVMADQHEVERWETATAIPILSETYSSLISLKKKITGAVLAANTGELASFSSKEKGEIGHLITIVEANKKVLRTIFGVCIDPNSFS